MWGTARASMAHSLEARVPFLDPVVTGVALALPTKLKVRGLRKKLLLHKAVEPLLPRRQLWGLLAFTLWHERYVERAPVSPSNTLFQGIAS